MHTPRTSPRARLLLPIVAVFLTFGCDDASSTGAGGSTSSSSSKASTSSASSSSSKASSSVSTASSSGVGGGMPDTFCNPVYDMECDLANGGACDISSDGTAYVCYNDQAYTTPACGDCTTENLCMDGTTCAPVDAAQSMFQCMHFCCTDADCDGTAGSCDKTFFGDPDIGLCETPDASLDFATPLCTGFPASAPSMGSCYTAP